MIIDHQDATLMRPLRARIAPFVGRGIRRTRFHGRRNDRQFDRKGCALPDAGALG